MLKFGTGAGYTRYGKDLIYFGRAIFMVLLHCPLVFILHFFVLGADNTFIYIRITMQMTYLCIAMSEDV